MRIALFSDTFFPQVNGVALTLKRLVDYLHGHGISLEVFVPGPGEESTPEHIHCVPSMPLVFYPECRMALPRYFFIRNQLQRFQPDLIHIATPFNLGLCGHYYGKKYGVPLVASYHTHFDRYLQYYGAAFAIPVFWRYIQWFHKSCQMTLVPSQETQNHLFQQGISHVELWKRGIDCQQFTPEKATSSLRTQYGIGNQFVILYAGRIAPEKDLDILLEIMDAMPPHLSEKLHWMICGEGPYLEEMRKKATKNITFTGFLPQEQLSILYASADLFCFPSSTETFGNVALEAMASGLPVIGADAGGVKEIIKHGDTGFLCTPRHVPSFMNALEELISNPSLIEIMGKRARNYALTQSWESIFDGLLTQYEKLFFEKYRKLG